MVCSRFVKLHVPMEVLKRYAEILKLRMKLKVRTISVLPKEEDVLVAINIVIHTVHKQPL